MADEPTAGELHRSIDRLTGELERLHTALDRLVRIDVYEAHRAALLADIRRLEARQGELEREIEAKTGELERRDELRDQQRETDRGQLRRVIVGAILACIGSIASAVVIQVLLR